ncbi:MAG: MFS transporter [Candidatus Dormibacteraceae bacterium]
MSTSIAQALDGTPLTRRHRVVTAVVGASLFFDIYDIFLAGTIGSVLSKQFHVAGTELALLLSSSFFGMFVGAILFGRLADRLGRRTAFLLNLGLYSFFTLLGAFSNGIAMLIALRFIAGLGIGAQPPVCDCYLNEVLPARSRGKYLAWAYTVSFLGVAAVGFLARFLVPISPLGLNGWRWLFILGGIGGAVVWLLAMRLLPESPRWLESRGRWGQALVVLKTFSSKVVDSLLPTSEAGRRSARVSISALFSPEYSKRTIMLWVFHLLQAVGYYGFGTLVPLVLAAKGISIINSLTYVALSFIGYPLGALLSVPIIEKVDRKWLIVGSALLMAIFGVLFGASGSALLIVAFGFLYTLVSNIFSNAFHVFQAEIFPTPVRATATGTAYSLSRLATGLLPFVLLPVLSHQGAVVMFAVIAGCLLVVMLDIAILAPRTTGRSLEVVSPVVE